MKKNILLIFAALVSAACSKSDGGLLSETGKGLVLTASVCGFENEEPATKVNVEGTGFENGDRIRMKVICPFTDYVQVGEAIDRLLPDGLWLLKYDNGSWTNLKAEEDSCDINGDFKPSSSYSLENLVPSQATTYVFTASTWTEEISFVEAAASGKYILPNLTYNNVFCIDQSLVKSYKSSDVLWAQQIMQTGTPYLNLEFKHVMAALEITVDDQKGVVTDAAVLTAAGLPQIDQQEIVVGDYYASRSKENYDYGYLEKCKCDIAYNGKVLGISAIDQTNKKAVVKAFSSIASDATYTAYKISTYKWRVIVPPISVSGDVVIWLRCGTERYSMTLTNPTFEQGKLYPYKMTVQ